MKVLITFLTFLTVCLSSQNGLKNCLKNPNFQSSIVKGLTWKFTGSDFWKNDSTDLDQLSNFFTKEIINESNFLSTELLDAKEEKLYKTKNLASKLLHLNDVTSFVSRWFGNYDGDDRLFHEDIFRESSHKLLELITMNIKLFKHWTLMNYDATLLELSESGKEEIRRIGKCLEKYPDEDLEDNLNWLSCFYVCRDLRDISREFETIFKSIRECEDYEWLGDFIIRIFMDAIQLNHCYFEVIPPINDLVLKEGDLEDNLIKFQTYVTPGVHCFPENIFDQKKKIVKQIVGYVFGLSDYCKVKIEMSTSNFLKDILPPSSPEESPLIGTSKCKDGASIVQVAMGFHPSGITDSSASIDVTKRNWNETFVVPLFAVIDHKIDGVVNVNFTIKMVADGQRLNTTKIPLKVIDGDSKGLAVCQSINDPHLVTFDNLYYNNLEQGYFILYKNTKLPYEVQVIYQSCGSSTKGESCNCAVAVKSHDDVFVIDRCRTRQTNSSINDQYLRYMKVTLFSNGEVTNGTRIFRKDGGLTYQILLPHGTMVTVKTNSLNFLNVWIAPSPYDRNRTTGLCGTYNDILDDDLQHSDGNFTSTMNVRRYPPLHFISSWRVKPDDRIFSGVSAVKNQNLSIEACRCSHGVVKNIVCRCGFDQLVESCNFDLGDEFLPSNISLITKKSKQLSQDDNNTLIDDRDVDESFQSTMNFTGANLPQRKYCSTLLTNDLIKACSLVFSFSGNSRGPINNAIDGCIDDMQITGNAKELDLAWRLSALDAAMETCSLFISRNPNLFLLAEKENKFENETCPNQCHMNGDCFEKSCLCYPGYHGPDCSFHSTKDYKPIIFKENVFCDSRHENCSIVRFHGANFSEEVQLSCIARPIKVTVLDKTDSRIGQEVSTHVVSPNQAVCILPDNPHELRNSHEITLKGNLNLLRRNIFLSTFQYIVYDSACMVCDSTTETCTLKNTKDYCLVDKKCYEEYELHIENNCQVCNTTQTQTKLTSNQDIKCITERQMQEDEESRKRKELIIRLVVSSSFSICVILVTIIMFVRDKKQQRRIISELEEKIEEPKGDKHSIEITSASKPMENNSAIRTIDDESRDNRKWNSLILEKSEDENLPEEEKIRSMSVNVVTQVRRRQRTFSEISVKSHGIGGGGPILFGCKSRLSHVLSYDNDESGIGGHSGSFYAAPNTKM